jgi:LacI family transcriptional regulator, galactose operon repressor
MGRQKTSRPGRGRGIVRLSDVAKRAGCSTATVSRVLNKHDRVNRLARERVAAAIQDLGYVRNGAAQALRSRRSRMIGAIIPTLNHAIYAHLLSALQGYINEHGYSLLVATSGFQIEQELREARLLIERGAEGLVLVGHTHADELYVALENKGVPFVNTYTYKPDSKHSSVGFDNRSASRQIVDFLIDLGHRDFAVMVGFQKDNDRVKDRIAGALEAIATRGVAASDTIVLEEPYSIEGGREGLRRIFARSTRPTALVCGSDVLAFGAIIECDSMGISVPRAISIVGFDDLEFAAHLRPPLTTVRVPAAEMGRRAGEFLLAHIGGDPHAAHYPLETNLILRRSAAPPAAMHPGTKGAAAE